MTAKARFKTAKNCHLLKNDCHFVSDNHLNFYFKTTLLLGGMVNLRRSSTDMSDASPNIGLGIFFASYVT